MRFEGTMQIFKIAKKIGANFLNAVNFKDK